MRVGDKLIDELKVKHGTVLHLVDANTESEIVARKPPRVAYKRFRSLVVDPAKRADAIETLMLDCVVWPDAEGWQEMLNEYPALAETFGNEVLKLAGAGDKVDAKKY